MTPPIITRMAGLFKRFVLSAGFVAALAGTGCRGKQTAMETKNYATPAVIAAMKPTHAGRLTFGLPPSAILLRQTQQLDGVEITLDTTSHDASLVDALNRRLAEIKEKPDSPIYATPHWGPDTGGIIYLADGSVPDYYEMEARRWLNGHTLVVVTSADKSKIEEMQLQARRILSSYQPGQIIASPQGFVMQDGTLLEPFMNQEDLHAEFHIPDLGTYFEFSTTVINKTTKVDLFEREEKAIALGLSENVILTPVRKDRPTVLGQQGYEMVISSLHEGVRQYDARFEVGGVPNSPTQPDMELHLHIEDKAEHPLDEPQFLTLWDSILASIKAN
jgi:hypothetical protein